MKKMKNEDLVKEIIGSKEAPVIVLFGGSPYRRDEVVKLIDSIGDVTIYGTLGEEEGMSKIRELDKKVDLILIGGRYDSIQRERIKSWVNENIPEASITQPGYDYPYSNESIIEDIRKKLSL